MDWKPTNEQGQVINERVLDKNGDIFIRAGSGMFKIRSSRLVNASLVFEDMFNLGSIQTHEDQELHDGLPKITFDDDPRDLEYFFDALINGW
jgi:hypothetical protein